MQIGRTAATLLGSLLLVVGPVLAVGHAADPPSGANAEVPTRAREPRPFEFYRGVEPRRVESRSTITGAHTRYVFEPVLQGDLVHHVFVIPNDSQETLEIRSLRMCSGCILQSHSRQIERGLEGAISFVIPTDALGGQTIESAIVAETSNPERPRIVIDVSLHVREFASVSPYRVWLRGGSAEEIVETCLVVPNEAYPFSIKAIRARKGIWFSYSHREVVRQGRKAYEITIENTRTKPGPYQDVLFVQTDHPERPELKIRIEGRIEG